jgi:hypothetical protein
LPLELNTLPGLPINQLRALWPLHMGKAPPPAQRGLLVRELAWRTQEKVHGGLDPETRRRLDAAVRAAVTKRRAAHEQTAQQVGTLESSPVRRPPAPSVSKPALARLAPGARLLRTWPPGGRTTHEVLILDGGTRFEYQGRAYTSLSSIAKAITGTAWSGPRFFGLAPPRPATPSSRRGGAGASGDAA